MPSAQPNIHLLPKGEGQDEGKTDMLKVVVPKSNLRVTFPLTPTLSLGEREKQLPSRYQFSLADLSTAFLSTCLMASAAEPVPADKSQYHLFNPTPAAMMREMSTDRPDLTESPYTVDAGHFQFETDLWNYSYDRHNSSRADTKDEATSFATINAKVGLLNDLDMQFVVPVYNRVRTHDYSTGTVTRNQGFGDLTVRMKYNVWGNDGGETAFGVMPFIKFPTAAAGLGNNSVEGGLILPLAVELPRGWSLGTMLEVDFLRDSVGSGRHVDFVNTITLGHDIIGKLAGYVEFFSALSTESAAPWLATANAGLTYGLTQNIQLDAGVNFGVTRSAPDLNPFIGLSWRF